MSTFRKNIQAIIDNNPESAAVINDILDLVDSQLLSIAASAKTHKPGAKMETVTADFNTLSTPFDNDPAAERALNQIATSITKALYGHPSDRPAHIQQITDTLNSIKDRPELHKAASEAGKLVLAALIEDAGLTDSI